MCCEACPRYIKCLESNKLKERCCSRCPDYNDCVGTDLRDKDSYRDFDRNNQE